jgi:hypothetical protein
MPYQDDEEGHGGAVSGRFSSAAPNRQEGANIQQVFGVESQKKNRPFTRKYIVKKLFKTATPGGQVRERGRQLSCSSGSSRTTPTTRRSSRPTSATAGLARDRGAGARPRRRGEKLTKDDKLTDFHDAVGDLVLEFAHQELTRTHTRTSTSPRCSAPGSRRWPAAGRAGRPDPVVREWAEAVSQPHHPHQIGGPKFQERSSSRRPTTRCSPR